MSKKFEFIKLFLLAVIALCLVIIVLQGFDETPQKVYVNGGHIYEIRDRVQVEGYINNVVDVNVEGVQGKRIGSHHSYTVDGKSYNSIDVFVSN